MRPQLTNLCRTGQAGKGMPRHVGGPEESVLAWRKSHEQDRCYSQQGDVWGALGAAALVGHAGPKKGILETCSAQEGAEMCDVLLSCSAPSMGARDQWKHQWPFTGVLPERQGHHGYTRGLHPTEIPWVEPAPQKVPWLQNTIWGLFLKGVALSLTIRHFFISYRTMCRQIVNLIIFFSSNSFRIVSRSKWGFLHDDDEEFLTIIIRKLHLFHIIYLIKYF